MADVIDMIPGGNSEAELKRRADAEKVLATLLFEAEKDVYRRAAGVVTDLDAAQKNAQAAAAATPEPKRRGRREQLQ